MTNLRTRFAALPTRTKAIAGGAAAAVLIAGSGVAVIHSLSVSTASIAGANTMPAVRTWRDSQCSNVNTGVICGPYHPNPDGWYAPNNAGEVASDIKLAQSIGVKAMRFDFPWVFMEPSQGNYDFTRADLIVNDLDAAGITPEPFIAFTPFWINPNATVAPSPGQFSSFTTAVMNHFKGRIHYLEMWNEPDHGHYWNSGYPAFMTDILIPGYTAAKAVDPSIQIIYPGLSNGAFTTFWQQTVTSGAINDFDAFAIHDYQGTSSTTVGKAHSFLSANGRGNVPVIIGEANISASPSSITAVDSMFASDAIIANWYDLRDDVIYSADGTSILIQTAGYGLFDRAGNQKAAAGEYAKYAGAAPTPPSPSPSPSPTPGVSPSPSPSPSPPPSPTPNPSPAPMTALQVTGNQLVDQSGHPVLLRGANMAGTEFVCAQGWSDDPFGGQPEDDPQTFAAMHGWGINTVRIPLNEDCWLGVNSPRIGGTAYQTPIIKLVKDLRAAGFYVILDLHWSAPGTQLALSQNPAPDEDHSPAFWKSVAATFASDHGVVYDLYNEPFFYWIASGGPDADTCLWNGCTLTQYETGGQPFTITANWQSAGFNELIGDIRGAGAQNVIMAAGVNWARDLSGWTAHRNPDTNLAASWHSYPSANPSLLSECAAQPCWDQVIAPLAQTVPVIASETGDSSAGPVTYLPSFLPWASSHGLSVTAWTWNAWQNPDDVLVTNMQTGAPTAGEGVTYQAWLAGVPIPSPAPSPSPSPVPTPSPSPVASPSPSPVASPTPTPPAPTPSPSPTPSPTPNTFQCVVIINGQLVVGTCTGTFSP